MVHSIKKTSITDVIKAILLTTLFVSFLGYIDYITGEISIDILYILCICVVTWYTNLFLGLLCIVEIIVSKITADYYDNIKIGTHLYGWSAVNFIFICIVISLLVVNLKKVLIK